MGTKTLPELYKQTLAKMGYCMKKILHEKFTESVLEERNYLLASCLILGGGQGRVGRAEPSIRNQSGGDSTEIRGT